jgi:hypothetical protein
MRMMRPGERATGGEPLGTSEATRGVAVMLAVIATAGLMLGGMELLGFSLMVPAAARELVWLEETVGPLRMALLVCALVLLGLWPVMVRSRGLLIERGVRRAADWVLLSATVLTMAGVGRFVYEGTTLMYASPWP